MEKLQVPNNGGIDLNTARALAISFLGEEIIKRIEAISYEPEREMGGEEILDITLTDTDKFLFRVSRITNVLASEDFLLPDVNTESQLMSVRDMFNILFWSNLYGRVYSLAPEIETYGVRTGWTVVKVE